MITGIHHVTAIASTPQANVDFYVGVLGLRLIKKTVNFDDPGTYHLYYGDGVGTPGTLMTFFPYGHILPGKRGTGETASVTFQVPSGSLDWWSERLSIAGHENGEEIIFGKRVIWALDPDGLRVEFEEAEVLKDSSFWKDSSVPHDKAIRTITRITLTPNPSETEQFLTEQLGFDLVSTEGERSRFQIGDSNVDVIRDPMMPKAQSSAGTIHHVAFRNRNDEEQEEWLKKLIGMGRHASPIMDRNYFHSIYFREPGGVLFEFATDGPGFTVDESLEKLGEGLMLPAQYESKRERLLAILPELRLP